MRFACHDILSFLKGRGTRLVTGRHAFQATVIIMAVLVADTNIRASGMTAVDVGSRANKSVMEVVTDQSFSDDTEVLQEDMVTDEAPAVQDQSYLNRAALAREIPSMEDGAAPVDDADDDASADTVPEPFLASAGEVGELPGGQAAEPVESEGARSRVTQYVVQDGDTVAGIAEKFGLKPSTLVAVNGLSARALIRIGMTLRIPALDGIIYVVKSGDTIGNIARRLSSTVPEIMKANHVGEDGLIAVGAEIIVPGGHFPTPVTPVVPRSSYATRVPQQSTKYSVPDDADDSGVASGKMLWPAGVRRISQYYKGRLHTGLDIAGPIGTPLYAADSGVVTYAGWNSGGYGYMTIVNHQNGYFTRYAHQTRILVSVGDTVRRGQVIGLMGSTGRSTGPHLHFEVMKGSVTNRLNPLYYIK